ncbi:MAG: glutamine-hydrolyzing GMP synthase [Deltaproteobacteria bacterium RBG_19FT_COMBO_60_16]|nr:MAG: glutamine-hydrolyzing GMP synthase [Deltaproteobacteria bacterium RBG_16_64_85]OGP99957.1 MAG: glutamine-hydrolyzing GMP synthase [Deltaproteobacteria bacterium RBG_19FT_COMBO_60_16]
MLIARRVRELKVYSEIHPFNVDLSFIRKFRPSGIILSGGPASVYEEGAPSLPEEVLSLGIPVLGICYGMQVLAKLLGGKVAKSTDREYGIANLRGEWGDPLFLGIEELRHNMTIQVWMSHGDRIVELPKGFTSIARSANSPVAAMSNHDKTVYGVQFHPEVAHTPKGKEILSNFLFRVCGLSPSWTMHSFVETSVRKIRETVGSENVVLGLSGGVDSSVAAVLLHKALGDQLTCIFVNNGLLRKGEAEEVLETFRSGIGLHLEYVDASERFLKALEDVDDPEKKRKIIGELFVRIFEEAAGKIPGGVGFLGQGTLYPDVIESVSFKGPSATIKTHHNVGGLPEKMHLKLMEPLRELFKDEVRELGKELSVPDPILERQPFPGPGLAVRIIGPVTAERLHILREADAIVDEEVRNAGLYESIWQSFAVLLPIKTVGVMGDFRTYENVAAIRAVQSQDGMTADWIRLPYDLLQRISTRIINEVKGVNRVVYDVSSKPPSTIEWE